MPDYPYHRSVRLRNFTVFRDATFEFVPGINVLVGGNGTGKTHLMKVMFAVQLTASRQTDTYPKTRIGLAPMLQDIMPFGKLDEIVRLPRDHATPTAQVNGTYGLTEWSFTIDGPGFDQYGIGQMPRPVLIPASDWVAHTRGMVALYDRFSIDFDLTSRDIVQSFLSPELREPSAHPLDLIEARLLEMLGGSVEEENERIYLRTPDGRIAMPLVAEGMRKLAELYLLIRNGWIKPGVALFWDEPEANLNPSLMDDIVGFLLEFARSGVQVFLATHSYVILSELDLQSKQRDEVRYFALEATAGGTSVNPTDDFTQLHPNLILEEFDRLWDLTLTRATGRSRKR